MSPTEAPALPATPAAPPPPPMFGQAQNPGKKAGGAKPFMPTFLGAGDIPSAANRGQKTLLGQ